MELTDAWNGGSDTYKVSITLKDLTQSILTVNNCTNEFDAKERAYLYLLEKIHEHKK